jgi:hypothetical protein
MFSAAIILRSKKRRGVVASGVGKRYAVVRS